MALAKYQKDLWDTVHTLEKKTKGDLMNDENFIYPKSNGTKGVEFEKILSKKVQEMRSRLMEDNE